MTAASDTAGTPTAVAAGSVGVSLYHSPDLVAAAGQQQQQQRLVAGAVGAGVEWPELPDADNLLLVGKGLVQVRAADMAEFSLVRLGPGFHGTCCGGGLRGCRWI